MRTARSSAKKSSKKHVYYSIIININISIAQNKKKREEVRTKVLMTKKPDELKQQLQELEKHDSTNEGKVLHKKKLIENVLSKIDKPEESRYVLALQLPLLSRINCLCGCGAAMSPKRMIFRPKSPSITIQSTIPTVPLHLVLRA
jgi:hypothetical protein